MFRKKPIFLALPLLLIAVLFYLIEDAEARGLKEDSLSTITSHFINLTVDPLAGVVRVEDNLFIKAGATDRVITFTISDNAEVEAILSAGKELRHEIEAINDGFTKKIHLYLPTNGSGATREILVKLSYRATSIEDAHAVTKRGVSLSSDAVIGAEGLFLPASALWYPRYGESTAFYDVTVVMPEGYTAVMEGAWIDSNSTDGKRSDRWVTENPLDGINIVVGKFIVNKRTHGEIDILTFFLDYDDEPQLSELYISKSKDYLERYKSFFTPYPYRKFAVVESFLPTGYGMPSYTLLGSKVLRLPFIPDTSLGHEFVHNWWGNSVFVDNQWGNWAEALASYTADHLSKEFIGPEEAAIYRKKALNAFKNYAGDSELTIKDFTYGFSPEERAVGYGKGTIFFHMLRQAVGDRLFYGALRRFYISHASSSATFMDIMRAFEEETGRPFDEFFNQWLMRPGGPLLSLSDIELVESGSKFRLNFVISQSVKELDGKPYLLSLPVALENAAGMEYREIKVKKEKERFEFLLDYRPTALEIDPNFDSFRLLSDREIPSLMSSFFGDKGGLYLLPNGASAKGYAPVAASLSRDYGQRILAAGELTDLDADKSLFIFGREGTAYEEFIGALPDSILIDGDSFTVEGKSFDIKDSVLVLATRDPKRAGRRLCLFTGELDAPSMASIARRLPHLTAKSWLLFGPDGGLNHGVLSGEKVLRFDFK